MGLKENIKMIRTQKNMTLEDLAKKVGVSRQTIQRYESGVIGNIPSDKIELIAKALRTSPADLMGWTNNSKDTCTYNPLSENRLVSFNVSEAPPTYEVENNRKYSYETDLISEVKHLNERGKKKLLDTAQEMTCNPLYNDNYLQAVAAHERTDIEVTADMIKHDDDIMNDDNF